MSDRLCPPRLVPRQAVFLVALAATMSASGAGADLDGVWLRPPPEENRAPRRSAHVAVHDPERDQMIVLGGAGGPRETHVWIFSLAGEPRWTPRIPQGTPPRARLHSTAVHDPVRGRILVFGGGLGLNLLNDLWALSLGDSPAWTPISPAGEPPGARMGHSAVYDPAGDRMIVFGGLDGGYRNDLWALSLAGTPRWDEMRPAGAAPPGRAYHTAVYDPRRRRMVVYGGVDLSSRINPDYDPRVWSLSLSGDPAWTSERSPAPGPAWRHGHGAILDAARDRMVIFGGAKHQYDSLVVRSDAWELALSSATWTEIRRAGGPGPRCFQSAIRDSERDRMIVFGNPGGPADGECWALDLGPDGGWSRLSPSSPIPFPPHFDSPGVVYDPPRRRMLLIGDRGETWSLSLLDSIAWRRLAPPADPGPDAWRHEPVYDPVRDRVLLYVGGPVWTLSLAGEPAWSRLVTSGEPPRGRSGYYRNEESAIYDPIGDRLLIFGGYEPTFTLGRTVDDLWALPLGDTPAWTRLQPLGRSPPARAGHAAFYDPKRKRMLVLGGNPYFSPAPWSLADLWELSLVGEPAWTELPVREARPAGGGALLDRARDRIVAFDGTLESEPTAALSLEDLAWVPLAADGTAPEFRYAHAAVFDDPGDRAVIHGGRPMYDFDDLWILDFWDARSVRITAAAEATYTGVRLEWRSENPPALTAAVYRRLEPGDWSRVGTTRAEDGRFVFEDRPAALGTRVGYRLGFRRDGQEHFLGETSVDVPEPPGFALHGARPNPTRGGLSVSFALPGAQPARLELFDVAGRRLLAREVGGLGPGVHTVDLAAEASLGVGVHWLRLTQGGRSATRKAVRLP